MRAFILGCGIFTAIGAGSNFAQGNYLTGAIYASASLFGLALAEYK